MAQAVSLHCIILELLVRLESDHLCILMDKVALRLDFLQVLLFNTVSSVVKRTTVKVRDRIHFILSGRCAG